MSYLIFKDYGHSESGKTKRFAVVNKADTVLGFIRWHGPWRKYVFLPSEASLFDPDCLQEIAEFVAKATIEHKEK